MRQVLKDVTSRQVAAKHVIAESAVGDQPLPRLFHQRSNWNPPTHPRDIQYMNRLGPEERQRHQQVRNVQGLLNSHMGEARDWHRSCYWERCDGPCPDRWRAPGLYLPQLIDTVHGNTSQLVAPDWDDTGCHWRRVTPNVVGLAEAMAHFMHEATADEIYRRWGQARMVIGPKEFRGRRR